MIDEKGIIFVDEKKAVIFRLENESYNIFSGNKSSISHYSIVHKPLQNPSYLWALFGVAALIQIVLPFIYSSSMDSVECCHEQLRVCHVTNLSPFFHLNHCHFWPQIVLFANLLPIFELLTNGVSSSTHKSNWNGGKWEREREREA